MTDAQNDARNPLRAAMDKLFPGAWSFLLGEVALFSFVALVLSGVYLALFYHPTLEVAAYHGADPTFAGRLLPGAFASMLTISLDVPLGLAIRRFHHFAAHVFIAAIVLHAARVFFTGAFRRPRRLTYWLGLILLILAIVNGFTGYCLPWDMRAGTATRMAFTTLESVPWVGGWLATLLFGAPFPGSHILPRLFIEHVLLGPVLIAAVLAVHLFLVVVLTHTDYPGPARSSRTEVGAPAWPDQAARSTTVALLVFGLIALLGAFFPVEAVWAYGPFQWFSSYEPLTPDWFLLWIEGAFRLLPRQLDFHLLGASFTNPFYGAVLLPLCIFALLFAYPSIEARLFPAEAGLHHILEHPRRRPFRAALGAGGLLFLALLSVGSHDTSLADATRLPLETTRLLWGTITLAAPACVFAVVLLVLRRVHGKVWGDRSQRRRPPSGQPA